MHGAAQQSIAALHDTYIQAAVNAAIASIFYKDDAMQVIELIMLQGPLGATANSGFNITWCSSVASSNCKLIPAANDCLMQSSQAAAPSPQSNCQQLHVACRARWCSLWKASIQSL